MNKGYMFYILCGLIIFSCPVYSQDSLRWDEVKGKAIIKELDQILDKTNSLKQRLQYTESNFNYNLDTILIGATRFKMAIRRKNKYAEQFKDDYAFYNYQLDYLNKFSSSDSIRGILDDIKTDMQIKIQNTMYIKDSSIGPSGEITNFNLVNLKVRVFSDSMVDPLQGYEVYVKRGIYVPSKDSVRIPQLTDNAVMSISPGNFTIIVWKGNQCGKAPVVVIRKPEEAQFICDIKIK